MVPDRSKLFDSTGGNSRMGRFFQFGITELFGLTVAVGFGFACWQASEPPLVDFLATNNGVWLRAIYFGTVMLVAMAALRESLLIHQAARLHADLLSEAVFEVRLLTFGRAFVALLLLATLVVELLSLRNVIVLAEHPDDFLNPGQRIRHGFIDLAVLFCICFPRAGETTRPHRWWHWPIGLLGLVASLLLALLVFREDTFVTWLVHLAIWGIAAGEPAIDVQVGIDWVNAQFRLAQQILWTAALAISLMLAVVWWPRISATRPQAAWWLAAVIHFGLLLLAAIEYVVFTTVMAEVIPYETEIIIVRSLHCYLFTAAMLMLVAAGWSYSMLRRPSLVRADDRSEVVLSFPDLRFSRLITLVASAVATAGMLADQAYGYSKFNFLTEADWINAGYVFGGCQHYFTWAVFVMSVVQLYRLFRSRRQSSELQLVGISPVRFAMMFEMALLSMIVGAPAIAWAPYAMWLLPWHQISF